MHTILLCGGSGQRLWPLSGRIRSKMFLQLLPAPDGGAESMIERVCRQLRHAGLDDSLWFVAHQDQAGLIRRYTGDRYPVIGEPHKRGTFTAAALGALHLYAAGTAKPDDIICVAPADMYADENFFTQFHEFTNILAASQAELALLGTRPAYPSDQYGYIVPGQGPADNYAQVLSFEEKPESARAKELVQAGALWNCGVFAFPLRVMLSHLESMGLPADPAALMEQYSSLPVRSFDKEVAERSAGAVVIPHEGEWCDLGSWGTLTARLQTQVKGNGAVWGEARDTHIVNELDIPLHVIGVPGIAAIASPEGILIAAKEEANAIKDILQKSPAGEQRYGETGWGSFTILDRTEDGPDLAVTLCLSLLPDREVPELPCRHTSKCWMILSGCGEVTVKGHTAAASAGGVFAIARGEKHTLRAYSAMKLIEIRRSRSDDNRRIYDT